MVLVLPTTPFKDVYIVMISYHISKEDFRLSTTPVLIGIFSLAFFTLWHIGDFHKELIIKEQ